MTAQRPMTSPRIGLARVLELGVAISWREAMAIVYEAIAKAGAAEGPGPARVTPASVQLTRGGDVILTGPAVRARPEAIVPLFDDLLEFCRDPGRFAGAVADGTALDIIVELNQHITARRRRVEVASVALRALAAEADASRAAADATGQPATSSVATRVEAEVAAEVEPIGAASAPVTAPTVARRPWPAATMPPPARPAILPRAVARRGGAALRELDVRPPAIEREDLIAAVDAAREPAARPDLWRVADVAAPPPARRSRVGRVALAGAVLAVCAGAVVALQPSVPWTWPAEPFKAASERSDAAMPTVPDGDPALTTHPDPALVAGAESPPLTPETVPAAPPEAPVVEDPRMPATTGQADAVPTYPPLPGTATRPEYTTATPAPASRAGAEVPPGRGPAAPATPATPPARAAAAPAGATSPAITPSAPANAARPPASAATPPARAVISPPASAAADAVRAPAASDPGTVPPTVAPPIVDPPVVVTTPDATPTPSSAPTPSPPASTEAADSAASNASRRALDTRAIETVLGRYRQAFNTLDAGAASTVWPTVDERTLARAFGRLESHAVSFDRCQIEIYSVLARATCNGRARYVPKVGNRTPREEARHWTFSLRKADDGWLIDAVDAR